MLPEWTIVGFTGHRKLQDPDPITVGIGAALNRLASRGPLASVSSAASGADTLFLENVARRNIPFFLLLPFHRERFKRDFSEADWSRVEKLFPAALNIEELGPTATDEEAYLDAGIQTVERADVLMAVWDGQAAAGKGGTADVVAFARAVSKPLIIVDPATGALIEERLELLPSPGEGGKLDGDPKAALQSEFDREDSQASAHAPEARSFFLYIILLHLLASAVAVSALAYHLPPSPFRTVLSYLKLGFLGLAVLLAFRQHFAHHHWIHKRIRAELLRSVLSMWRLSRGIDPFPPAEIPGFERMQRSLRLFWYTGRKDACGFEEAKSDYLRNRVRNQIKYFRHQHRKASTYYRLCKWIAYVVTGFAIISAIIVMLLNEEIHPEMYPLLKMLSVVFPLANAAALSLLVSHDLARRTARYAEMRAELLKIEKVLVATHTWPGLARSVIQTERLLLGELAEWHSAARVSGEAH